MALIEARFFSPVLEKQVQFNAMVPNAGHGPFPVFYLLHGYSDDYSNWLRYTRLELYAGELPVIIVMPDGFHGFYTDNHIGRPYGRYMIEDVVGFAERVLPIRSERSARCIGGLSMGGYGSLRLALAHPEMFVSATSHSGAAGYNAENCMPSMREMFQRVFPARYKGSEHDVVALAAKVKRDGHPMPKLRIDCGKEDYLLQCNRDTSAGLNKVGYKHEYAEYPGSHNWEYWDEHIKDALAFHCRALGLEIPAALAKYEP
jgi:putative tributyrin esterase